MKLFEWTESKARGFSKRLTWKPWQQKRGAWERVLPERLSPLVSISLRGSESLRLHLCGAMVSDVWPLTSGCSSQKAGAQKTSQAAVEPYQLQAWISDRWNSFSVNISVPFPPRVRHPGGMKCRKLISFRYLESCAVRPRARKCLISPGVGFNLKCSTVLKGCPSSDRSSSHRGREKNEG